MGKRLGKMVLRFVAVAERYTSHWSKFYCSLCTEGLQLYTDNIHYSCSENDDSSNRL